MGALDSAKAGSDHGAEAISQTGGVSISGESRVGGDVIGRDKVTNIFHLSGIRSTGGSAPPVPNLFIGREEGLHDLKKRLGITSSGSTPSQTQVIIAVRGWPGVGKTTMAAALANDQEIQTLFPDGVLWISIGEKPNLLAAFATWGRALGDDGLLQASNIKEATPQLATLLRQKRMLLIADDVWETVTAEHFRQLRGNQSALVFTTRFVDVADAMAPTPEAVYTLPVLTEENALLLLQALAPTAVQDFPNESRDLVRDLEYLPLALQVAGHMLNAEARRGWDVGNLLSHLRQSGQLLLDQTAPADRVDLEQQRIPTVDLLLQKSVERLDERSRECFAYLGAFAPKPATFDLSAMNAVWQVDDPKSIADTLIDGGLLEPIGNGRFQMHALLVSLAKSILGN